jgi:hypothetical protein
LGRIRARDIIGLNGAGTIGEAGHAHPLWPILASAETNQNHIYGQSPAILLRVSRLNRVLFF